MTNSNQLLRAIIIDDEQNVREMLSNLLANYCNNIEVIGVAETVKAALSLIHYEQPDLLLLDIDLPDGTGFDLLEQLGKNPPLVIFITAYNDFAIRAFRFSAIDYLLKPINIDNLVEAIAKAADSLEQKNLGLKLQNFFENMNSQPGQKKLVLKTQESIYIVKVTDIVRCEADHNYTTFSLADRKKILVSKTIKEYEELLADQGFFRTHQSHLININHISSFEKGDGGYLKMADGSMVPVSKRKKEELLELFSQL